MPYRIDIYIGSDNDSKRICKSYLKKVKDWAIVAFPEGYTLVRGEGCYNGVSEDSVLLSALSKYDVGLRHQFEKLKQELRQDAILVVKSAVDFEVF
jgi:predicted DNA binding protein